MAQPQGTPRPKSILNDYGQPHPETEKPLQGAKRNGQLRFEQKNNGKIVLRVYDNVWVEGAKRVTREVELNYAERGVIFDNVRLAAEEKTDFKSVSIPINQQSWIRADGGNKMSDEAINQCNIIVTRRDDGRVTLTYQKADYKFETVFRLVNCSGVRIRMPDGQVVEDAGRPSRSSARAWCAFHEPLLNELETNSWKPRENKNGGNGGGNNNFRSQGNNGGGNNNWSGGNNNNTAPSEETFEDIDW